MIDPAGCILYLRETRSKAKRGLWEAVGRQCGAVTADRETLAEAARDLVPIIGCHAELRGLVAEWSREGRPWLYKDNGYLGRADLLRSPAGTYRWHWCRPQLGEVGDYPGDRFAALGATPAAWRERGGHVVLAAPGKGYAAYHGLSAWWATETAAQLRRFTDRPIRLREKGSGTPLAHDLAGAHALVTHGSIAAVEAVMAGVPAFVDRSSAVALLGNADLARIEAPETPDRTAWLNALAYAQFTDAEMLDGTLWRMLPDAPAKARPADGRCPPAPGPMSRASSLEAAPA